MNKQCSTQCLCAKAIRQELKANFPKTKFRVTSESFAGGDSVDIRWENGSTYDQVNNLVRKYQYGHFDGMIDYYECSNMRKDVPQVKYVMCSREITPEFMLNCVKIVKEDYEDLKNLPLPLTTDDLGKSFTAFGQYYNWYDVVRRVLSDIDLTDATTIKVKDNYTGGSLFSGFEAVTN